MWLLGAPIFPNHYIMGPQQAYHPKGFSNRGRRCTEQCDLAGVRRVVRAPVQRGPWGVAGLETPYWKKKLEGLCLHKVLGDSVCVPDSPGPVLD